MYNRYTPQSDGSYRRDRVPDPRPAPPRPAPPQQPHYPPLSPGEPPPCPPPVQEPSFCPPQEHFPYPPSCEKKEGIFGFLRQLLPRDFDTEDLLIILLLLLMAGDREEDRSNALLTLALYIFM